jgi:hypothetical protein
MANIQAKLQTLSDEFTKLQQGLMSFSTLSGTPHIC